jgi:hypothetical protein
MSFHDPLNEAGTGKSGKKTMVFNLRGEPTKFASCVIRRCSRQAVLLAVMAPWFLAAPCPRQEDFSIDLNQIPLISTAARNLVGGLSQFDIGLFVIAM